MPKPRLFSRMLRADARTSGQRPAVSLAPGLVWESAGGVALSRTETTDADWLGGSGAGWLAQGDDLVLGATPDAAWVVKSAAYRNAAYTNNATAFTYETWMWADAYPANEAGIINESGGYGTVSRLRLLSDKRITLDVNIGGKWYTVVATTLAALQVWYHLAGVWTGSEIQIYVNGVLEDTLAMTGTPSGRAATSLGYYVINNGYYLNGRVHEARIWNHARSAAQIQDGMKKRMTGGETGLLACWPANDGSGAVLKDVSPTAGNLSINGTPGWLAGGGPPDLGVAVLSATRQSPDLDISSITTLPESLVDWQASLPAGSGLVVETSIDNGASWQVVTQGDPVPGLTPGAPNPTSTLQARQTLQRNDDTLAPALHDLTISFMTPPARHGHAPARHGHAPARPAAKAVAALARLHWALHYPLLIVSDAATQVTQSARGDLPRPATPCFEIADWADIPGATWIWDDYYANPNLNTEEVVHFARRFEDTVGGVASLSVCADNIVDVWLDGRWLARNADFRSVLTLAVRLDKGPHELRFACVNIPANTTDPTSNPAGLIYKLSR